MEAWAADTAKQIVEQPIFMTWNFFLTACGLPALAWFITRTIKTSDEMKERLFKAVLSNIEEKIADWQVGAKERTRSLCEKIDKLSAKVDAKVDNHECERVHAKVDEQLQDIKKRVWT